MIGTVFVYGDSCSIPEMYTILKICILYAFMFLIYIHRCLISIHLTVIPCLCVFFLPKSHGCHKTYPESPSETGRFRWIRICMPWRKARLRGFPCCNVVINGICGPGSLSLMKSIVITILKELSDLDNFERTRYLTQFFWTCWKQGHLSLLTSQHSTRRQAKPRPMNQVSKADLCLCIEVS